MLKIPAVIGLQYIGYGDHQVKGMAVVAAAAECLELQALAQLQKVQLSEPVTLLKGLEGVLTRRGGLRRVNSPATSRPRTPVSAS